MYLSNFYIVVYFSKELMEGKNNKCVIRSRSIDYLFGCSLVTRCSPLLNLPLYVAIWQHKLSVMLLML